jgi:short-subunit dehydrogenase
VKKGVEMVLAKAGGLDVLICNAGMGIYGSIEEMPLENVRKQFEINFFGYLRTLQAVLPHFREKRSGRIVLVGSLAGILAIPFQTHYSATKYAIEGLTEGLRQELHGFGIKVSAVRPGDIRTNFNDATQKFLPEDSPYSKWSRPCWDIIDKNLKVAPEPKLVAKKIFKIIKTKNPQATYTAADFFSGLMPVLMPFMSSKVKEKILRIFYGVDFV